MASNSLLPEDFRALDQMRQRLFQLASNIQSLKVNVQQNSPLPPWSSIQTSATILGTNMNTLVDYLSKHSDLLNRTNVYPSTNYPGRTQEPFLHEILRKKHTPQVETWIEEGRATQAEAAGDKEEDLEELWNWARDWTGQRVAKYVQEEAGDSYTVEEREAGTDNVRTGLKRKLDEDDESEEDEDEEMEDVAIDVTTVGKTTVVVESGTGAVKQQPSVNSRSLEDILRVTIGGVAPNQRPNGNR